MCCGGNNGRAGYSNQYEFNKKLEQCKLGIDMSNITQATEVVNALDTDLHPVAVLSIRKAVENLFEDLVRKDNEILDLRTSLTTLTEKLERYELIVAIAKDINEKQLYKKGKIDNSAEWDLVMLERALLKLRRTEDGDNS